MMGFLSWITGVGVPFLIGIAALAAAAGAYAYIPKIAWLPDVRTPVCAALVGLGVGLIAYSQGYASARSDCQDATLRTELAQARADLKAAQSAAAQAREIGERLNQSEARNMELAHELANRPVPDDCRADDDDVKRLRNIR